VSKFPADIDEQKDLLKPTNNWQTTLASAIESSSVDIALHSGADVGALQPQGGVLSIESEVVKYEFIDTGGANPLLRNCTRGYDNTTAASHGAGTTVASRMTATHHDVLVAAILKIEQALGPIGSSTRGPCWVG
jgi:hypothetical protein